jgi:ADP-heptose:LPS heptosyltransferase/glycosyltransferase involved in cell wall biosynthesis
MNQKISSILAENIRQAVTIGVNDYLATKPEKRQQLEEQGVTLSNVIYERIIPLLNQTKVSNVLIIMEEGIGNMLMLTPALRLLKHTHPLLKITVLGKQPAVQVIEGWNVIDKVITSFDNDYYDLCVVTIWGKQTAETLKDVLRQYCKQIIEVGFKVHHEAIQHMACSSFLDCVDEIYPPHCEIAKSEDLKQIKSLMEKHEIFNKPYIIFGDTTLHLPVWEKKRWPYYHDFAELIRRKFPEYKIVLIGDEIDKKYQERLTWPDNVTLDFMNKINIPQLAYLIKHSKFYIGNDTGPTHIAAAVGTKTYAIFGPTLVCKNKPLGKDVTILNKRLPCAPCQYTDRFENCDCINYMTAEETYNKIFHPKDSISPKTVTLLVGDFSSGALRNEHYIKNVLEKEFNHNVYPLDYRHKLKQVKNTVDMTYVLLNEILHREPDLVLICGGQQLVPEILTYLGVLSPKTKVFNWYVDNRGQVEQWFYRLSSVCHSSFWSTGDPKLLSQVFSQTQKPCEFLPIVPDDKTYYPIDIEKDIDVLFVGTPHSKPRIDLLTHLVDMGINVKIYGNGEWPDKLKTHANPGIFGNDFNKVLNRSKIVLGINIINEVPLYFSDRYFYPMAVKTVGLNKYVPQLEDMFEDKKHMVFFKSDEDCAKQIRWLLKNKTIRNKIAEEGHKLYKEKYTLKHMLKQMLENL